MFSDVFKVSNGVRQGGILSPAFFNLYMNDLSVALTKEGYGCQINGNVINHLFYADDSVLLSPSPFALQKLLDICDRFAKDVDLTYNTKKSFCICVKPKMYKNLYIPKIFLNGSMLPFTPSHKYLGILLDETQSDDNDILRVRKLMYAQGNKLICHFNKCTDDVKVKLFKTYFNSFYGITLWSQYKTVSRKKIVTAYKQVFRKLMHIVMPQGTSTKMVALSIDPFEVIERKMIYGFMNRINNSENCIVKCISNSEFYMSSQLYINWSDKLHHI